VSKPLPVYGYSGNLDGLKTGSADARRGQCYDPERAHYFSDAGFGNFAEDYRDGFSRGHSDGFRREASLWVTYLTGCRDGGRGILLKEP
jgi:hypothetical protein